MADIENIRDNAGDCIDIPNKLLKKFKMSIFWVIWYRKWVNEADLIKYLNQYRNYQEEILAKTRIENENNLDKKNIA